MNKHNIFIVTFILLIAISLTACAPQPLENRDIQDRRTNFDRQQKERPSPRPGEGEQDNQQEENGTKPEDIEEISELVEELNELNNSVTSLDENSEL